MRAITIAIYILLFSINNTISQENISKEIKKDTTIEKFDQKKFNEVIQKNQNFYYTKDSTKVCFLGAGNQGGNFQESRYQLNSYFSSNKIYDRDTKLLISTGKYFQDFQIGIHKTYNKEGVLISEVNYDSLFPFCLDDLIKKIKRKYGLDLLDVSKQIYVTRKSDVEIPYYQIFYRVEDESNETHFIVVNGITGKVISEKKVKNQK